MATDTTALANSRRNRMIAIAAGVITIVAIVLAFASGYLGQQWNWLRPAGELLLLAELVGLIVLERHQLFEPVYHRVEELKADNEELKAGNAELRGTLAALAQQIGAAGQVTVAVGTHESVLLRTRILRQALAREQEGPQVLRTALLSGTFTAQDIRESSDDWQAYAKALSEFSLLPGSASSKGHRWSARTLLAIGSVYALETGLEFIHSNIEPALNVEIKILVRQREASLSPATITDRDIFLTSDDENTAFRWGLALQGQQYVGLFARWFDDRWSAIPDSYLIYSRNGLNTKVIDRIRKELEAVEGSSGRRTA